MSGYPALSCQGLGEAIMFRPRLENVWRRPMAPMKRTTSSTEKRLERLRGREGGTMGLLNTPQQKHVRKSEIAEAAIVFTTSSVHLVLVRRSRYGGTQPQAFRDADSSVIPCHSSRHSGKNPGPGREKGDRGLIVLEINCTTAAEPHEIGRSVHGSTEYSR